MGRPYETELSTLAHTYQWALQADIDALAAAVSQLRELPLIVIGSGGSMSVCLLAARLHEIAARLPARVLSPLEFSRYPRPQAAGVLMLSAGGRNPDILAAARHAMEQEYEGVVALCARGGTPLSKILNHSGASTHEFIGPSKKDGFLATNSLLQSATLLARAYGASLPVQLPAFTEDSLVDDESPLKAVLARAQLVALADGWAVPAAADLESKWAEIGFGSVVVTDSRNFAHGRHFGLSVRARETGVVAFSLGGEDHVTRDTVKRIAGVARTGFLSSPATEAAGAIDLLVRVMRVTGVVGQIRGVDPGRPKVPDFGRALYHATFKEAAGSVSAEDSLSALSALCVKRKVTPAVWSSASIAERARWQDGFLAWKEAAEGRKIGGVVVDYDGTLCEAVDRFLTPPAAVGLAITRLVDAGMVFGIATGRGDSAVDALRSIIPERAWPSVILGLYNGGVVFRLDQSLPSGHATHASIEAAYATIRESTVLADLAHTRVRPTQLTVRGLRPLPRGLLYRIVCEALAASDAPIDVRVTASGHSVDIISADVSKCQVVDHVLRELASRGRSHLEVMTIGDQGQLTGNDSQLLNRPLGLSVESVSTAMTGCWNVAPAGEHHTRALLTYLSQLTPVDGDSFRWRLQATRRSASRGGPRQPARPVRKGSRTTLETGESGQ